MLVSSDPVVNHRSASLLAAQSSPRCASDRWYAVFAHPNHEAGAQIHLRQQGFKTFLPRYAKCVRHARQVKTVMAPLFPRYLFVALDLRRDRWRSVNGTRGVVSLVTQDGAPAAVAIGAVEALRASCDDDGVMTFEDLRPGQSVRVTTGPFAEQIGVLERLSGPERVRVLLGMMHGQVTVDLARCAVEPG